MRHKSHDGAGGGGTERETPHRGGTPVGATYASRVLSPPAAPIRGAPVEIFSGNTPESGQRR